VEDSDPDRESALQRELREELAATADIHSLLHVIERPEIVPDAADSGRGALLSRAPARLDLIDGSRCIATCCLPVV
jgi:8-oxo-dGTP pyrophosphatase MutT (NUDIX family)